jgi:hypothetical protein
MTRASIAFASATLLATACGDTSPEIFHGKGRQQPVVTERICGALIDHGDDGEDDARASFAYDDRGNHVASQVTTLDGTLLETFAASYDQADRLIATQHDADGDGADDSTWAGVHDDQGRLVAEVTTWPGGQDEVRYTYEGDVLTALAIHDGSGALVASYAYAYDADGRLITVQQRQPDDQYRVDVTYEDEGYLVRQDGRWQGRPYSTEVSRYSREDGYLESSEGRYAWEGWAYATDLSWEIDVSSGTYTLHQAEEESSSEGSWRWAMENVWQLDGDGGLESELEVVTDGRDHVVARWIYLTDCQ